MNQFFKYITDFIGGGGDNIPWTTPDVVQGCEREVADAEREGSEDRVNDSIMRWLWALVHSRRKVDVDTGMAMLEDSLTNTDSPLQMREKLYLLSVGYYRNGVYPMSLEFLDQCLEITPDWGQALYLRNIVEEQWTKEDNAFGIGAVAAAAASVVGIAAVALARRG